jgi:hypothetical protein
VAYDRPASGIAVADLDEDGFEDVILPQIDRNSLLLFAGAANRRLTPAGELVVGSRPAGNAVVGDVDEDGHVDVAVATDSGVAVFPNRTFHPPRALRGNVNAAAGRVADVLLVNGSAGGPERRVVVAAGAPLAFGMELPPARTVAAKFIVHSWVREPDSASTVRLPGGLGMMSKIPRLVGPAADRRETWNNVGRVPLLGAPTRPSSPAPSEFLALGGGVRRRITFVLQGLIRDPASPSGSFAVTNGVVVEVR